MESGEPSALKCSPNWKRPEEVMKYYQMKLKKRALTRRCMYNDEKVNRNSHKINSSEDTLMEFPPAKRRNPFKKSDSDESVAAGFNVSLSDHVPDVSSQNFSSSSGVYSDSFCAAPKSFENLLWQLNKSDIDSSSSNSNSQLGDSDDKFSKRDLAVDWSLKSKLRFMSTTPFSWNAKLKTCEEASGITGFVRCLDTINNENCTLDTSHNARFHQCCLYWQHPNLPWLELFPRNAATKSSSTLSRAQLAIASDLQSEWEKAFRSLFQLITARQCPYFYFIANHFTCLFRAAGIGGLAETHAIVTPTTRGLRKMLSDEDVEFTMPLKSKKADSVDSTVTPGDSTWDDDDEDWLASFDSDSQDIKRLTTSQRVIEHNQERKIDKYGESLVLIQGADAQAFFNVLVNCKSFVSNVGAMAGVPPTLLSPVSFSLATLKSLKVKNGVVHVDGADFYSIEIEGPILPHSLREMCHLLNSDKKEYSAVLATVKETKGFTHFAAEHKSKLLSNSTVFLKANLSDCGLSDHVLSVFCEEGIIDYSVIDSIEPCKIES